MVTTTKRPPADRGQGRKSVQGAGKSPVLQVVVTPEQKAKVQRLGGARWVRGAIDKAREVSNGDK
ncbi:MAG: hypothetical protein JJD98_05750 [Polaromonas sp.]|nr:hypothetical protein [Polaromonas sp.]